MFKKKKPSFKLRASSNREEECSRVETEERKKGRKKEDDRLEIYRSLTWSRAECSRRV